jgi:hypothetical protein
VPFRFSPPGQPRAGLACRTLTGKTWSPSGFGGHDNRPLQFVLGILTVAILVFLGLTWRGGVGWILSALVASLVVQGALHEALGAATNSRFSLKAFAAEVARVEGPVYFYGPVIRQIVYHARRHIHPIEAWPEGPLFLIATEEQLAEFRGTYPVRQLAAGEGRVGESDNQRVLLLSIDGR